MTATFASQVITGLGNIVLPIMVARSSPNATHFAYFSVCYFALAMLVVAVRLTTGDYLRMVFHRADAPDIEQRGALGRAVRLGLAGCVLAVVMWLIGWPARAPIVVVAGLTGVAVSIAEAVRSVAIATGCPGRAVRIDIAWTLPTVAGAVTLNSLGVTSPSAYLGMWAGCALFAVATTRGFKGLTWRLALGARQPALRDPNAMHSLWREFFVLSGTNQLMFLCAATVGGAPYAAALGAVDLANRPARLANQIAMTAGVPEAARMRSNPIPLRRFVAGLAVVLVGLYSSWWTVLGVAPRYSLDLLLGNSAQLAESVLLPYAVLSVASAFQTAARVGAHGLLRLNETIRPLLTINVIGIMAVACAARWLDVVAVAWVLAGLSLLRALVTARVGWPTAVARRATN